MPLVPLGAGPLAAAGDFNGDGRGDLVTNESDGRFGPAGAAVILDAQLTPRGTFARRIVRVSNESSDDDSGAIGRGGLSR